MSGERARRRRTPQGGFTLIEVCLVLVIMGIVTAGFLAYGTGYLGRARHERARYDIRMIIDALKRFHYFYPQRRVIPVRELEPHFLAKIPIDPWGQEYRFNVVRGAVQSAGPDNEYDSVDDLYESYPVPRCRLLLIRGGAAENRIVHVKIRGRFTTSAAVYHDRWGREVDPVSFISHFRHEYDFYLDCGREEFRTFCPETTDYPAHDHTIFMGDVTHVLNLGIFDGDVHRRDRWNAGSRYGAFEREILFIPLHYVPTIQRYFEEPHSHMHALTVGYAQLPAKRAYLGDLRSYGFAFFCTECADDKPVVEIDSIDMWCFDDLDYWMFVEVPYYGALDNTGKPRRYYRSLPERLGYDDLKAHCDSVSRVQDGVIGLW